MREIKFRAWGVEGNGEYKMYYPGSRGNYYKNGLSRIETDSFGNFSEGLVFSAEWQEPEGGIGCGDPDVLERQLFDVSLMQYTGLKDKNDKEIYEGDVYVYGNFALNDTGKYGEECWERLPEGVAESDISTIITTDKVNFTPQGLMRLYTLVNDNPDVVGVEVIGNIYENPSLLADASPKT